LADFAIVRAHAHATSRTPGGVERWEADLVRALAGRVDALADGEAPRHRYRVVHAETAYGKRLAREMRAKLVQTFHGAAWLMARHGYQTGRRGIYRVGQTGVYAMLTLDYARTLARVDAAVCVSRKVRDHLRAQTVAHKRKVVLIENGVDVERFHPPAQPERGERALFYGRLEPNKGLPQLLDAVGPDVPLDVAGGGSLAPLVERVARERPNVRFLGALGQEDLVAAIGRARLVCTPSLNETFGLVGIEALACGTPAVLTREFDVHGETGRLLSRCEPTPASIREAIRAAWDLKTPAWSRAAREAVCREYDFRGRARAYLALYEHLAAGGAPRDFAHPEAAAPDAQPAGRGRKP
jgi:glycosyltransferase involved in cell wall biosynthesis